MKRTYEKPQIEARQLQFQVHGNHVNDADAGDASGRGCKLKPERSARP